MYKGIKSWFSTYISLYLKNDTKYGHRYNVRQIGTLRDLSNSVNSNGLAWSLEGHEAQKKFNAYYVMFNLVYT